MTFWAKFLTVVILVLAIAFAAISAILFTKRSDYRKAYVETAQKLTNTEAALAKEKRDRAEERQTLTANLGAEKTRADNLQSALTNRDRELKSAQAELDNLRDTIKTIRSQLVYLQTREKEHNKEIDQYKARNNDLEKQVGNLTTKLHNTEKEAARLAKANEDLTNALQSTREELHLANQERQRVEKTLNDLALVYPGVSDYIKGMPTRPLRRITGKVLQVDPENQNVIINVGREAGVKEQFRFIIHRGTQYVGRMVIFHLEGKDLAAGKIEYLKTDADGNPLQVRVGDDVVSGLGL